MKPTTVILFVLALVGTASAVDSLNFRTIGFYGTADLDWDVALDSDYACITDINRSLRILSVADPEHVYEVGHYDTTAKIRQNPHAFAERAAVAGHTVRVLGAGETIDV